MALDKLIDSGALDGSLNYTAQVVAAMLMNLAGLTGQPDPMPYDLTNGTGFGAAILSFTSAHPLGGSAPASLADVSSGFARASAGVFTLAQDNTSGYVTLFHNLGAAPDIILLASPDIEMSSAYSGADWGIAAYLYVNIGGEGRALYWRCKNGQNPSQSSSSALIGIRHAEAVESGQNSVLFYTYTAASYGGTLPAGCQYHWLAAKFTTGGAS